MLLEDHGPLQPRLGLALEVEALRQAARAARGAAPGGGEAARRRPPHAAVNSAPGAGERLIVWESRRPCVVLPRRGSGDEWARVEACADRGVPLLHRESGGGAVVVGPGCLNVALVLSLHDRPWLADVEHSYDWLLGRLAGLLTIDGIAIRSTDLAIGDRKFAGHAQRRMRGALLHHGVVLYDFDLELIDALLLEPPRRPAWRGARTHREFLVNAPLARDEVVRRLRRLPSALECCAGDVSRPGHAREPVRRQQRRQHDEAEGPVGER